MLITYYQMDGVRGLTRIIDVGLGNNMIRVMDKLARNAFFNGSFKRYGTGTGVNLSGLTASDLLTTTLIEDVHQALKERDVPTGDGVGGVGPLVCITTPGAIRDLKFEASAGGNANAFIDVMKYADGMRVIRGEVGSYHGVRFVETNDACLYNAGTIVAQTTVTAAIAAGDGAPNPSSVAARNVEYVGQPSKTHYITVADSTGFNVGDAVTLHVDRTSANGVANGLDWTDGKAQLLRIQGISGNNITFYRPVMEAFSTDLGGGVYAYLTKAQDIHTAVFVADTDGVTMGVAEAPTVRYRPPVDDLEMIHRFVWEGYFGYQTFNPYAFEVAFLRGSNGYEGPRYITKT